MLQSEAWEREYSSAKAIPSTTRRRPSNAVKAIIEKSEYTTEIGKRVLDVGCGAGRNTIYLAEQGYDVTAIDFCSTALELLKAKCNGKLSLRIHAKLRDITKPLPFDDNSFDAAFDIVTTTSITHAQMRLLERELRRVIAPGGVLVSFVHSRDDGYLQAVAPGNEAYLIGENQIIDHTWTKAELESLYKHWEILHLLKVEKMDDLAGRNYIRRLWYIVLRNKD